MAEAQGKKQAQRNDLLKKNMKLSAALAAAKNNTARIDKQRRHAVDHMHKYRDVSQVALAALERAHITHKLDISYTMKQVTKMKLGMNNPPKEKESERRYCAVCGQRVGGGIACCEADGDDGLISCDEAIKRRQEYKNK